MDNLNDYTLSEIREFFSSEAGKQFRKIMDDGMNAHIKDAWEASVNNKSHASAQYNSAAHAIRFFLEWLDTVMKENEERENALAKSLENR